MLRAALAVSCAAVGVAPAQQFVKDTDPSPAITVSSDVGKPVAGARGWFRAKDSSQDAGLYETDGTVAGTRRVFDGFVQPVREFAGRLLFTIGAGLFSTDGTVGGTVQIVTSIGEITVHGSCNGRLIFSDRPSSSSMHRIWSTDTTPGGTVQLGQMSGSFWGSSLGNEMLLFGYATAGFTMFATDGVYFVPRFIFPAGGRLPAPRSSPS
jgi:ELWxxDGT repeat protein